MIDHITGAEDARIGAAPQFQNTGPFEGPETMSDQDPNAQAPEETPEVTTNQDASAAESQGSSEETAAAEGDPLTALQAENAELKDRLMRALAEVENTRRRADKDRQDASRYGSSGLAKEILPVIDNLGRALQSVTDEQKAESEALNTIAVGVDMVAKQLVDALGRFGVKQIDPAKGEKFSYDQHQAMSEIETPDQPTGTIVQTLQPGYIMHDRLLRAAMVIVAKGGPAQPSPPPEDHTPIDTTA